MNKLALLPGSSVLPSSRACRLANEVPARHRALLSSALVVFAPWRDITGTHRIFTELHVPGMTDDDYQRAFVLSRPRAKWLVEKLRCMLVHSGRGRPSMDPAKQVCMFLHACAKAHVYRDVLP